MFSRKENPIPDKVKECFGLPDEETMSARDLALARCNCLMERYLRWKRENHRKSNWCQYAALILTSTTPVLLLIPYNSMRFVAAVFSAVAAIATGLLAINGWRDNYIRYGSTWHALQGEKYLYLEGVTKEYSDSNKEEAARAFASRVEHLVMDEVLNWQALMLRPTPPNGTGGQNGQAGASPS